MNLAKFSHKTFLVGIATLLALGVGAGSSNIITQPVQARSHRVHHRHYRHHSHRRHHAHYHMSRRERRRFRRNMARYRHYRRIYKRLHKEGAKDRWWTEHIYQDPSINFVNRPYKLHKNLWTQGYLDGSRSGNVSPMHTPCVNAHHIYSTHGKAGNYRLGWIAGFVNGNIQNGYVPVHHSVDDYILAMRVYHNTARAVSEPEGAATANGNHGYFAVKGAQKKKFSTWMTHREFRNGQLVSKKSSHYRSVPIFM